MIHVAPVLDDATRLTFAYLKLSGSRLQREVDCEHSYLRERSRRELAATLVFRHNSPRPQVSRGADTTARPGDTHLGRVVAPRVS